MIRALVIDQAEKRVRATVREVNPQDLPPGDTTVRIRYSGVNYKDAMVIRGLGGMVRSYPHVPGIDFVGEVIESEDHAWQKGDKVILTGHRVGESRWGGFAQQARVESEWLVRLPKGMTAEQSMALGTAGLTAMLAVMTLQEQGVEPGGEPVLVTGATGGVGTICVMLLKELGYPVHASTGKPDAHALLRSLGADEIIDRQELAAGQVKALDRQRWAGCVDSVGGQTLAHALSKTVERGCAVSIGLTGGDRLDTSLTPFLLRGVRLIGVASASCPHPLRERAWRLLNETVPFDTLASLTKTIGLADPPAVADAMLAGQTTGRVLVDVNA